MQKGNFRSAAGAEIAAEAEVYACKNAVPNVAPQILPARQNNALVRREQRHNAVCCELHNDGNDNAEADCYGYAVTQGLHGSLRFACTDVLRSQGGNRRKHGGGNQKQKADDFFHDADGGGVGQSSLVSDDGDHEESNLNQTVLQSNGYADF